MRLIPLSLPLLLLTALAAPGAASAQAPAPNAPAKELFGKKTDAAPLKARAVGFYSKGCLAGGLALPVNGKTWQVMRLSRNRNWGHPELISFLERFASQVPKHGWPGILVGDLAQPRGGPMLTGHASHQVGLDADIWLTPMPVRTLGNEERETFPPQLMVRADRRDIDPAVWTPNHMRVIRIAAEDPLVERIFVNAAIKKALCREAGRNQPWMSKVRPYWGHDYHMHIRIRCPKDSPDCTPQPPVAVTDDACGPELDWWFRDAIINPPPPKEKPKPRPPITMAELPPSCRDVLIAK